MRSFIASGENGGRVAEVGKVSLEFMEGSMNSLRALKN
jgi:hypothetical protein